MNYDRQYPKINIEIGIDFTVKFIYNEHNQVILYQKRRKEK